MALLLFVGFCNLLGASSWAQTSEIPGNTEASPRINDKVSSEDVSRRVDALQAKLGEAQDQIHRQQVQIEQLQNSLHAVMTVLEQTGQPIAPPVERALVAREASFHPALAMVKTDAALEPTAAPVLNDSMQVREQLEDSEGPKSIRYKGLNITPGGFLEGTLLWRSRNENADISNSYTGSPLNGSSNSKLSEYRGSARDSRLSLLFEGHAGSTLLSGYYEVDFLGASPTANFVQASAFTPRIRQAWVQLDFASGWTVTGGQFFSLMTTNRKGIAVRDEYIPATADGSYVVGYNWVRERNLRVTKKFSDRTSFAFELDDPENTFSAAFVPANVMGLNTSQNTSTGVLLLPFLANYSNGNSTTIAPDLLAKVAFDPGWGHFEIKAVGRYFRDRIASTATTVGKTNTSTGYGVGFAAVLPVRNKVDFVGEGLFGQGIGRYGASALPDATLDPVNARMLPLRSSQVMGGVEWHPKAKTELYGYFGDEYVGRYAAVTSTGAPAGYGSPLVSYAGCTNEVATNTCSGANRNILEGTFGYWYTLYRGTFGTMQYGNQLVYFNRTLWSGIGPTPRGSDLVVFSTMRFYLP